MTETIIRPLNAKTVDLLRNKLNDYISTLNAVLVALGLEGAWSFNTQQGYLEQTVEQPQEAPMAAPSEPSPIRPEVPAEAKDFDPERVASEAP